ncbi:MAG: efflux RND transporter periplasmic adaptor subunit [Deltaproteobacteria bacterium]|nr:efflux RND transporter periplasmic adaptor subunit [Deltaproteobacteria bacterium]MBW2395574.1 efflux RND transporter periplasmic adaptor subunit [Deltaproteobacteria bacterium]
MNKLKRVAIPVALGLSLLIGSAGNSGAAASTEEGSSPRRIALERVRSDQLQTMIAASGSIEARRITEIGSEVSGRITEVFVDVGEAVEEGAPLFQIDREPYEMALAEARAGLALCRAESLNADAEAERIAKLIELNAASQQRYDKIRTQAEVARARVRQGQAGLDRAKRNLDRTLVTAPYAASIVERRAHEGSMSSGAPVLVVQERGALEFIVDVPEAAAAPVRPGDPVKLFVEGLADPIESQVDRVSARVDPQTRTYEVRGVVLDASGLVKAGSYVRAELHVRRPESRPVVHRSSVLTRDGRTYVMQVDGGVVRKIPVRVGIRAGSDVELLHGATTGDLLVSGSDASRVSEGTRIRLREPVLAAQSETLP